MSRRFHLYTIKQYNSAGVLIKGRSERIAYGTLTDEERKWLFLFSKSAHQVDRGENDDSESPQIENYEQELVASGWKGFEFSEVKETKEGVVDSLPLDKLSLSKKEPDSVKETSDLFAMLSVPPESDEKQAIVEKRVFNDLISVSSFVECLRSEGRDERTCVQPFLDCVLTHRNEILLGHGFVLKKSVDDTLTALKTPPPKKKKQNVMTPEEKEAKLKKQIDRNNAACLELGVEAKNKKLAEPIGNVMAGMRASVVIDEEAFDNVGPVKVLLSRKI